LLATVACEPIEKKFREAVKSGALAPRSGVDTAQLARDAGVITAEEYAQWQRKEVLRKRVIMVDDFPQDFGRAEIMEKLGDARPVHAKAA
jgi:acyl-CoA dehydrogenase